MDTLYPLITTILTDLSGVSAATWMIIAIVVGVVWLFSKANNDPASPIRWEDLIITSTTNKASPYKVGYMIGVIVSTWVIVQYAIGYKLTIDLFATYLMFLIGGIGWISFINGKYNTYMGNQPTNTPPPAPPTPPSPNSQPESD